MAFWQVHEMYPEIHGPSLNNSEGISFSATMLKTLSLWPQFT